MLSESRVLVGQQMKKNMLAVISVAVIALAALIVSYPEYRVGPTKLILLFLWFVVAGSWVLRLYKTGTLNLTPEELYNAKERPKIGFIEYLAIVVGAVIIIFFGR